MAKSNRRDKFVKYLGDDSVSADSAIIAAGMSLMEASEMCQKMGDSEGLIRIANAWYDIAKMLLNITEEEEESKTPFGFGLVEEVNGDDPESDKPDKGPSGPEIRKKSW
jgi:hypothetical protein